MDARNLAIMFGPTLVRPQDNNMMVMVRDMRGQCRVVESIIVHCDWFFSSWDEDVNVPMDEESEESTPISSMNEELLAKAESLVQKQSPSSTPGPNQRDQRYKELVNSIINAANRKIRHRDKTSKANVSNGSTDDLNEEPTSPVTVRQLYDIKRTFDSSTTEEESIVTRYTALHFDTDVTHLTSTENSKPCIRRTQSTESLSISSPNTKIFYEDFTVRLPPRTVSPQLLSQLHFKRQLHAKHQFLLEQPAGSSNNLRASDVWMMKGSSPIRVLHEGGTSGSVKMDETQEST